MRSALQFASLTFLYFFLPVLILYWLLDRKWQNHLLLVASYVFYGAWDWRFLSLIWISTIIDYVAGLQIESSRDRKKFWLTLSLVGNLGILFVFKYYNFFSEGFLQLLKLFGIQASLPVIEVILPVGISFYTFQTLSYTIDVYRGTYKPTRNVLDFSLYVAFFPQLLSGPIERANSLLPQLENRRVPSEPLFWTGIFWICLGYYKKVVVAENLIPYTKPIFAEPGLFSSGEILMGLYTGMMQVYCDFSGYSDIAIGLGALLGIKLTINFRQPLLSNNPSELWRRWHVTFYYWLRDYIYFPLVNRKFIQNKSANMAFAVSLTFLFAGLWHGANIGFIVWAGLLAILLIIHRLLVPFLSRIEKLIGLPVLWKFLGVVTFFHLWAGASIFFASQDMQRNKILVARLFAEAPLIPSEAALTLGLFGGPLLVYEIFQNRNNETVLFSTWNRHQQFFVLCILIAAILFCGVTTVREFEYFQF